MSDEFWFDLNEGFKGEEDKEPPCKGVFFRYTENNHVVDRTKFVIQKQISMLKRISCPGCSECGWLLDDACQGMDDRGDTHFEFASNLKHGDLVQLQMVVDGHDWEMGYVDEWHLKVVKSLPPLVEQK